MGKKAAPPPADAELLYSRLLICEPRDGLVLVKVASGEFTQAGMLTLRMAMELHHGLGIAIDTMIGADVVTRLDAPKAN